MKKNHKNKFKTPEGYFDSFNDRLLDKIAKETSPIPKSDGFGVPEGYFNTVYQNVSDSISKEEPRVINLKSFKTYFYAVASIAAILLLVFYINVGPKQQLQFDDLASNEIVSYFEDTEIGLSSYEIAQTVVFNTEELDAIEDTTLADELILEYIEDTTDSYDELNLDYEFEE